MGWAELTPDHYSGGHWVITLHFAFSSCSYADRLWAGLGLTADR